MQGPHRCAAYYLYGHWSENWLPNDRSNAQMHAWMDFKYRLLKIILALFFPSFPGCQRRRPKMHDIHFLNDCFQFSHANRWPFRASRSIDINCSNYKTNTFQCRLAHLLAYVIDSFSLWAFLIYTASAPHTGAHWSSVFANRKMKKI